MSAPKKPSGAAFAKARRQREAVELEREKDRLGLNAEWKRLLDEIGPPAKLDAVATAAWANRLSAAMAWTIAGDETIPLGERFKRVSEQIDRVASTTHKAHIADQIRSLRKKAGLGAHDERHRPQAVLVDGSTSLRARSRTTPPDGNGSVQ